MNQTKGNELAAALVKAFRDAARRHTEAANPKTREPIAPKRHVQTEYSIYPPAAPEKLTAEGRELHKELAQDYESIADAIERHAAKETEA